MKNNFILIYIILHSSVSFSQKEKTICKSFKKLSRPEKCWIIVHPFIAKKVWKISVHTNEISTQIKNDSVLDGDISGGQVDAFRHAFWMASLCQKINWRKARKLGIAHEKGNKIDFKKGKKEDEFLPDSVSVEMDLFNNKIGILLGKQFKNYSEKELISVVKKSILSGEMKIIKKDSKGNSLDENNEIISDWIGKWNSRRILVSSDYQRKKED